MAKTDTSSRSAKPRPAPAVATPEDPGLDEVDVASIGSMDASDPPAFGGVTGVGEGEPVGEDQEQRIRVRAHELWQQAGSPPGAELDFWLAAEREIGKSAAGGGEAA